MLVTRDWINTLIPYDCALPKAPANAIALAQIFICPQPQASLAAKEAKNRKYSSFFKIYRNYEDGPAYKIGDSIEIRYDPKQPFIHKINRGYLQN